VAKRVENKVILIFFFIHRTLLLLSINLYCVCVCLRSVFCLFQQLLPGVYGLFFVYFNSCCLVFTVYVCLFQQLLPGVYGLCLFISTVAAGCQGSYRESRNKRSMRRLTSRWSKFMCACLMFLWQNDSVKPWILFEKCINENKFNHLCNSYSMDDRHHNGIVKLNLSARSCSE